jgi:hypothetical protein
MPEGGCPLPSAYGVTRLTLLPRDPQWMHAYWEVAPYTWVEARNRFGDGVDHGRGVLRLFLLEAEGKFFDVAVDLGARNWYLTSPAEGYQWRAELGVILEDGRFVLLAMSNSMEMPRGRVSDILDEKWGLLGARWDRLFELSGGGRLGMGSGDVARGWAQRWDMLQSIGSWSTRPGASSAMPLRPPPRHAEFWLEADAEVVVHGATEPDARVTFRGRPVALRPDGTFTFRFPLPDGSQKFPITAVHRDGALRRAIAISVDRETRRE